MRSDQEFFEEFYDEPQQVEQGRLQPERAAPKAQNKRINYGRRGIAPTAYNGIHRRRKKRIMW